jgi:predicted TIM-barrel fold metal-dependent hydrolase
LAKVLAVLPELRVIAAHFGGYLMWERAKKCLVGRNVWLDTSSAIPFLGSAGAAEIVKAHGADRVLWGSDYPAVQPQTAIAQLESLGLPADDLEKIFYRNAENLLNIHI